MTVSTLNVQNSYLGDGVTVNFALTFACLDPDWVVAYVDGILTAGTVTLNTNQDTSPGGTFAFGVAPALNAEIVISRATDLTQETDYPPYTRFPARDHEEALDKLTMINQEQADAIFNNADAIDALDLRVTQNENDIIVNADAIAVNIADIADLDVRVTQNESDIATNTSNIATNTGDIATLESNQIISSDTQVLAITNPTLANNVTLNPITNVANGLVKLNGSAQIPVEFIPVTGGNEFPGGNPSDPVGGDPSAALIVGTVNPDIEPSLALGPSVIQSRADQNTVASMQINPYGGDTTIGNEATMGLTVYDTGPALMYQQGALTVAFATLFTNFFNTIGLNDNGIVGLRQGSFGPGGTDLSLSFNGDADTGFCSPGANILQMVSNADDFSLASSVSLYPDFAVFSAGASQIFAYNSVHGGFPNTVTIGTAGNVRARFDGINGCIFSDNANNLAARTLAPASGGFEVNNTLTGAGFERVLTTSDLGTGTSDQIRAESTVSATLSSTLHAFQAGLSSGENVRIDNNSINVVNNGVAGTLRLGDISSSAGVLIGGSAYIDVTAIGTVRIGHDSNEVARGATLAAGGFLVNNTVTGAGFERVLTTSDKSDVVLTSGNQSIAGNKTFTGSTTLDDTAMSSGGVLTLDGTQAFNVPVLNFSADTTLGLAYSDGGRNPASLSIIVGGAQTALFSFDSFVSIQPVTLPTYTVAAAPAAQDGSIIYCSNGDAGSPCLAVRSGGAWLRVALGAAISAT